MTTPRVTELPRRLEPICADPFLAERGAARAAPRPLALARESRPAGVVVPLRPRDPLAAARRRRTRRRSPRAPFPGGGSGDEAA